MLRPPVESAQYASSEYVIRLQEAGAKISMAAVGNPYENAKAQSFFRTLKMEEVYLKDYRTLRKPTRTSPSSWGGVQPQEIALQPRVSTSGRIRGTTCHEGRKLTMSTVRKNGFTPHGSGPSLCLMDRRAWKWFFSEARVAAVLCRMRHRAMRFVDRDV